MLARRDQQPQYNTEPNTFIVGAPKAGTTSLHRYLNHHPDASVSAPKEPYYFLETNTLFTAEDEYLDLWADTNTPVRVEASPTYLYEGHACQNIHDFNPNANILIISANQPNYSTPSTNNSLTAIKNRLHRSKTH